jgi:hypothetical protein
MRDRRLDPVDAEDLAPAYQWLIDQPYIDAARSGLLGTCVGGAFALLASSQPAVRDRIAFVGSFAPYASMWTFARDIASSTTVRDGKRESWSVDPLTRDVFERSVLAALVPDEQAQILAAIQARDGDRAALELSADGQAAYRLLRASDEREAESALHSLSAPMQERLAALSPLTCVDEIHAPLIAFGHDRDDGVIPVSESHQPREALTGRTGVRYTEFQLFQHATPRRLPPPARARARSVLSLRLPALPRCG